MKSGESQPSQVADVDRIILEHIGRYHVSFAEIIGRLNYPSAAAVDQAIIRLKKNGYIDSQKDSRFGARLLLTLTPKAVRELEISKRKDEQLGPRSLPARLAVLAFGTLGGGRRVPLMAEELESILGVVPPGRHHALEDARNGPRVLKLYVPGPSTARGADLKLFRKHIDEAVAITTLVPWIENGFYRFIIVVDSEARAEQIKARADWKSLSELVNPTPRIGVSVVLPAERFEEALREEA